ncbi:MAG TPA: hypothetical protein VGC13_07495 [Longimicrobium sp.]|jgi:hypothetical protein|uniref:hypothetical protein n=1 Tax=Longimicrobium sp. TaxID=2029185 RepID=UPI002ED87BA5
MSTQGFFFDVYNNTGRTINVQIPGNIDLVGAQGNYTLNPGTWASAQDSNAPLPLQLNGGDTGSLIVQLQLQGTTASTTFTLEFDGTKLTNFPGMAFYGSAGDIANPLLTDAAAGGYVFPLLYMNQQYNGNPLAVLMLVETVGASPYVATPYGVS